MSKPSLPKGVRDFGQVQMARREYIFSKIKSVFKKYCFQPIETPAMENLSVLTGKYGAEGDQLIFKILNSGNYINEWAEKKGTTIGQAKEMLPFISDKALRYDLTVPFARYVVMNRNEIVFPFKRYQIQPVWRADRPQKGRYREFYQCDADVVGTNSLICEAEIVMMINEVLNSLGIENFAVKINNRKILAGITEVSLAKGKETDVCVAIDKIDKIGEEGVIKELLQNGLSQESIDLLLPIIDFKGDNQSKLNFLKSQFANTEEGQKGIIEVEQLFNYLSDFKADVSKCELDLSLARGLSYYTGAIFEVKALGVQIGSISGGGRYDNLTSLFGLDGVSGVGISFGVDRIYDVMDELNLFSQSDFDSPRVLVVNFDSETEKNSIKILATLRSKNIKAEIYPQPDKLKKQFSYADSKNIPFVMMAGENEIKENKVSLKNMKSGEQFSDYLEALISKLEF